MEEFLVSKFKSFLATMVIIAISGALFVFWDRLGDCLEEVARVVDYYRQEWHWPQIRAQPLAPVRVSLPQSADQWSWPEWLDAPSVGHWLIVSAERQVSVTLPAVKTGESSSDATIAEAPEEVGEEVVVEADSRPDMSEDVLESVDTSVDYNTQPELLVSVDTPAAPTSADTKQTTITIVQPQPTSTVASAEPASDAPQPQPAPSVVSADPLPSPPQPQVTRPRPKLARPRPAYFVTVEAYDQNLDEYFYVIEAADGKTLQWREQVPGNYYFLFGPQIQVTAYKQGQVVTQISPLTHSVVISPETCDLITIKKVP
ncbi:hypothetical protein IJJ08_04195 [bacterium]|nr:hypothetical protein [bacterium]